MKSLLTFVSILVVVSSSAKMNTFLGQTEEFGRLLAEAASAECLAARKAIKIIYYTSAVILDTPKKATIMITFDKYLPKLCSINTDTTRATFTTPKYDDLDVYQQVNIVAGNNNHVSPGKSKLASQEFYKTVDKADDKWYCSERSRSGKDSLWVCNYEITFDTIEKSLVTNKWALYQTGLGVDMGNEYDQINLWVQHQFYATQQFDGGAWVTAGIQQWADLGLTYRTYKIITNVQTTPYDVVPVEIEAPDCECTISVKHSAKVLLAAKDWTVYKPKVVSALQMVRFMIRFKEKNVGRSLKLIKMQLTWGNWPDDDKYWITQYDLHKKIGFEQKKMFSYWYAKNEELRVIQVFNDLGEVSGAKWRFQVQLSDLQGAAITFADCGKDCGDDLKTKTARRLLGGEGKSTDAVLQEYESIAQSSDGSLKKAGKLPNLLNANGECPQGEGIVGCEPSAEIPNTGGFGVAMKGGSAMEGGGPALGTGTTAGEKTGTTDDGGSGGGAVVAIIIVFIVIVLVVVGVALYIKKNKKGAQNENND